MWEISEERGRCREGKRGEQKMRERLLLRWWRLRRKEGEEICECVRWRRSAVMYSKEKGWKGNLNFESVEVRKGRN